jgi:HPr kinase/phosphorylase
MSSISIEDMIKVLDMEVVYKGKSLSIDIETSDINRPGLQFAGFFDYFAAERVQVIGKVEMTYLDSMEPDIRAERLERFFSSGIPCVLISRNMEVPQYLLDAAGKYGCPIIRSKKVTTSIIHRMINYLDSALAPRITRHGVLVDVYGIAESSMRPVAIVICTPLFLAANRALLLVSLIFRSLSSRESSRSTAISL